MSSSNDNGREPASPNSDSDGSWPEELETYSSYLKMQVSASSNACKRCDPDPAHRADIKPSGYCRGPWYRIKTGSEVQAPSVGGSYKLATVTSKEPKFVRGEEAPTVVVRFENGSTRVCELIALRPPNSPDHSTCRSEMLWLPAVSKRKHARREEQNRVERKNVLKKNLSEKNIQRENKARDERVSRRSATTLALAPPAPAPAPPAPILDFLVLVFRNGGGPEDSLCEG